MRDQMNSISHKTALALVFTAGLSLAATQALADSYDFEQAGKSENQVYTPPQTVGNGAEIHTQPTHTTTTANTQAVEGKAKHDNVSGASEAGQSLGEDAATAAKAVGDTTREVTTTIGHTARDTTKTIGHSTRDFFRGIGDGLRKAW